MSNSKIKINMDSLKSRREWKRHKVKDGHNIFRILPPFGEASNGYPYRKWQIIWGLKNPEDGRMRPFASSMTSEKRCPVFEFVSALKVRAESLRSELQASGTSEAEIKERLGSLSKVIQDLSLKTVYVYNASDKSGEVGLLELKSTAHKKMKQEMQDYVQVYNQDPTSLSSDEDDSGVWFDVVRSGLGRDTEYDVKKCQQRFKNEAGKISFEDDRSALADSVVQNYDNLGYDLTSIYQLKSYEDLQEVLQANMEALIEFCPDVDLGNTLAKPAQTAVVESTIVKSTKKVNLKLDDADDEDEAPVVSAKTVITASAPIQTNAFEDDFLKEANDLLNS